MDALQTMLDEHRIIGMTIKALGDSAKKLQSGKKVPKDLWEDILEVLKNFADGCHHKKEEAALFPLARGIDANEAGMVSVLLEEHERAPPKTRTGLN